MTTVQRDNLGNVCACVLGCVYVLGTWVCVCECVSVWVCVCVYVCVRMYVRKLSHQFMIGLPSSYKY